MNPEQEQEIKVFLAKKRKLHEQLEKLLDQERPDPKKVEQLFFDIINFVAPDMHYSPYADVYVIDRTLFEPFFFHPLPYRHKLRTKEEKAERFKEVIWNLDEATKKIQEEFRMQRMDEQKNG